MIENGSEMARAEDTMMRIATNSGYAEAQVFSTVTGIIRSQIKKVLRLKVLVAEILIWKKLVGLIGFQETMRCIRLL